MMSSTDNKLSDDEDFDETDGPQDNSIETTQSASLSGQNQSHYVAQECVVKLENAVKSGNVTLATEMAIILAGMRAVISVKSDPRSSRANLITVTINVEDKNGPKHSVVWKLQPSISVFALKWKMFDRFGYSPEYQQWIIGKTLAEDNDKLVDCGIRTSGSVIILYLLTPAHSKQMLSPEAAVGNYSRQISTSSQSTNVSVGSLSEERLPRPDLLSFTQVASAPQPVRSPNSMSSVHNEQVGWQCPMCTLINEPTRPGCELCACDRPATYQVPAAYTPSEKERRRLLEEQKLDQLLATQSSHVSSLSWSSINSLEEQGNFDLLLSGDVTRLSDEQLATQLQHQEDMLSRVVPSGRHLEPDAMYFSRRDQSY